MNSVLKNKVIRIVNAFDVDGDLNDYAYWAHELLEEILEDIAVEESMYE